MWGADAARFAPKPHLGGRRVGARVGARCRGRGKGVGRGSLGSRVAVGVVGRGRGRVGGDLDVGNVARAELEHVDDVGSGGDLLARHAAALGAKGPNLLQHNGALVDVHAGQDTLVPARERKKVTEENACLMTGDAWMKPEPQNIVSFYYRHSRYGAWDSGGIGHRAGWTETPRSRERALISCPNPINGHLIPHNI